MADIARTLAESVRDHVATRKKFSIRGGGSKNFLGEPAAVELPSVDVTGHRGIISYEPRELVLRARCGTPISEIVDALAAEGQMLGFEPPDFDGTATLGGTIASGLSGPRRPWSGAARDFVLGVALITGEGEVVEFGGQVMKNVAGFDVSRLMCGSMGTLGIIADVSLKVLPAPRAEVTLARDMDVATAHRAMVSLAGQSLPVSAACWFAGKLYVRLSGSEAGVRVATEKLDGDPVAVDIWRDVAHFRAAGLAGARALWRLSVPQAHGSLLAECSMIDWGGAQRWLADPQFEPRQRMEAGHATLFRAPNDSAVSRFTPLDRHSRAIHQGLKRTFDPAGVVNPGRLYRDL